MKAKKTVYQRIMDAYRKEAGLRLSAQDVHDLAQDDAIETRAWKDSENADGAPDKDLY